jgi:hypothetical protein
MALLTAVEAYKAGAQDAVDAFEVVAKSALREIVAPDNGTAIFNAAFLKLLESRIHRGELEIPIEVPSEEAKP